MNLKENIIKCQEKSDRGKFITLEGGEGAGKSTQVRMLKQAFALSSKECIFTREPGGSVGAEMIRDLIVKENSAGWNSDTELLLHLAARSNHLDKTILPNLLKNVDVVCDRFSDSTIAYQGYGHGLDISFIETVHNLFFRNFVPDITIILDIMVKKGIKRADSRGDNENRYEKMGIDFHDRVNQGFLEIARSDDKRCFVINAKGDIYHIHKQIVDVINSHLGMKLLYAEQVNV